MNRYIATFKTDEDYKIFLSENDVATSTVFAQQNIYFVYADSDILDVLKSYCDRVELRPENIPVWKPLQLQNRIQDGGSYNDYTSYLFLSGFQTAGVGDPDPGVVIGPWYVMTGYCGLLDAWNVAQGSGVTVSCQEKFDYTHPGYQHYEYEFKITGYKTVYAQITGGDHEGVICDGDSIPEISSLLENCFFYTTGDQYHFQHGNNAGCLGDDPPDFGVASWYNPDDCYTHFYSPGVCTNGCWRWDGIGIPSGFAPFGHGDVTTSILASRISPLNTITGVGSILGNVGFAPLSTILLGNNGDAYKVRESELGVQVRVGAFDGQWSQTEADIAHTTGTVLVRPPGTHLNTDAVNCLPQYYQVKPINTVSVSPARYIGNEYNVYTETGLILSASGNYGMYAGYGRDNYVDFAAPAVGVWCHHPRYNYRNWGTYGAAFDGASVSAAAGGGMLALLKSKNPTWKWEDIVTVLCQSCAPYEYRTMPGTGYDFGLVSGSANIILQNATTFNVDGTSFTDLDNSVNWRYAYSDTGMYDIDHQPYNLIQFGRGPEDSEYEIMLYDGISSNDSTVTGSLSYNGGSFDSLCRGYAGTIPKLHLTNSHKMVYAPIVRSSGWSRYLGWGLPNLKRAMAISKDALGILPPQRFTATGIDGKYSYWNNKIRFDIAPMLSSNYGGVTIVKNPFWYPRTIDDGTICYETNDSDSYITGYDYNITPCPAYYTAFQFKNTKALKYSSAAMYAATYMGCLGYPGMTYGTYWDKYNILPKEVDSGVQITISTVPETKYAKISGYYLDIGPGEETVMLDSNTYTITGLSDYTPVALDIYAIPSSENLIGITGFAQDIWQDWTWSTSVSLDYTNVQKYHESKYSTWSKCIGISGVTSNATWLELRYWFPVPWATCTHYNVSFYAKLLHGGGTLSGFAMYYQDNVYGQNDMTGWTDLTDDWQRFSWDAGDCHALIYNNMKLRLSFADTTSEGLNTLVIANPQLSFNKGLNDYSIYYRPRLYDGSMITASCACSGHWEYGGIGDPVEPENVSAYLYDNHVNIGVERDISWNDSYMEVLDKNKSCLGTMAITGMTVSGDMLVTEGTPNSLKIYNDAGKFTEYTNISSYDFRSIDANRYSPAQYLNVSEPSAPSFGNGESNKLFISSGDIELSNVVSWNSTVVTGVNFYTKLVPVKIKKFNDASAYVGFFGKNRGDGSVFYMGHTSSNYFTYRRKPGQTSFDVQAVTIYGTRIESNTIYYTTG